MLKNILIGIAITLLIVATGTEISFPPKPKLLYNPSASAPIGWYKLARANHRLKSVAKLPLTRQTGQENSRMSAVICPMNTP